MHSLPLTLFERYLYHEDRPGYPCWILTRFRFEGTFKRDVLQRAWEQTALRHPLLTAVVRRNWRGRLVWTQAPDCRPVVEWAPRLQDSGWPDYPPIDLERAPGCHLFATEEPGRVLLFLQVHHSLHDGAGTFAVIDDLLIHYARELGEEVDPAELHPERLPDRNRFGLSFGDKLRLLPMQALGLALSIQLHGRTVAPLLPDAEATGAAPPSRRVPALASRRLGPEEFRGFRAAAKRLGAGLQDILIRDAQAALGAWLKDHGRAGPRDWIRLAVPVNLRRPADLSLPAANLVGLVIIDRRAKSLANRERLLVRAREDMGWVRRKRLGYVLLVQLGLCGLFPGGIRRYVRRSGSHASFLLTNLGQILSGSPLYRPDGKVAVPGAVLEDVALAAPVRPGTCACLAVGVYGEALAADLSYDSRVMTPAQAEALVQAFADQVRLTIGSAG